MLTNSKLFTHHVSVGWMNMQKIVLATALLFAGLHTVQAELSKASRSDILYLLTGAIFPVMMETYCAKQVGPNKALNEAAERFVHRHSPILDILTTKFGLSPDQVRSGWE